MRYESQVKKSLITLTHTIQINIPEDKRSLTACPCTLVGVASLARLSD